MKQIVFLPSDFYTTHDPPPGAELRFIKYSKPDGSPGYEYFSRGKLEDAMDNGDEVWVIVEAYHLAQDYNQWWLSIVPRESLIVVPDLAHVDCYGTLDALRSFALRLAPGISEDDLQRANTWMRILDLMVEKGFVRACSLRP